MRVAITGATGFVGRHCVTELLQRGHEVLALTRSVDRFSEFPWAKQITPLCFDLDGDESLRFESSPPDALMHLAWQGLPRYHELFHIENNLPCSYKFIDQVLHAGCTQILVTGTCFEYGNNEGCLSETAPAEPLNAYATAKDALRRFLQRKQKHVDFRLQWARLFYMHGEGQNPKSLLAQLEAAIERGDSDFPMSGGQQLRDYLPVTQVAHYLVRILENCEFNGIVNVCSGEPISVRGLVEHRLRELESTIQLRLGAFPYATDEPMAFWGDPTLLQSTTR